jgi:hypothetical protein
MLLFIIILDSKKEVEMKIGRPWEAREGGFVDIVY